LSGSRRGPAQNASAPPKNILPIGTRSPSISIQQRNSRPAGGSVSPSATITRSPELGEKTIDPAWSSPAPSSATLRASGWAATCRLRLVILPSDAIASA
jgi:hypothetical protein